MKRTRFYNIIAIATLIILLLPLLTGCTSQHDTATASIPDGWEAVSTEGNITRLQLKEGSDAYHWMDYTMHPQTPSSPFKDQFFPIDIELCGNPEQKPISALSNEEVHIIVYYGYMKIQRTPDGYQLSDELPEQDSEHYILRMFQGNGSFPKNELAILADLRNFTTQNSIRLDKEPAPPISDNTLRIGFSDAVLVSIPRSDFNADFWYSYGWHISRIDHTHTSKSYPTYGGKSLSYLRYNNKIYFSKDSFEAAQNSFPYVLFNQAPLILFTLCIGAIVLIIVGIIRKRRWPSLLSGLISLFSLVYIFTSTVYVKSLPDYGSNYGLTYLGVMLILRFAVFVFIVLAIVALLIAAIPRNRKPKA
jgi:hypothetical protein